MAKKISKSSANPVKAGPAKKDDKTKAKVTAPKAVKKVAKPAAKPQPKSSPKPNPKSQSPSKATSKSTSNPKPQSKPSAAVAKAKKPAAKPAVSQKNTTKVKSAPPKTTPAKSTKTESSKATKTTAAVKSKTDTPAKASEPAKAAKPAKATKVVAAAVEPAKVVKAAEPVKAAKASAKADKPKVNAASSSAKVSRGPVDTAPEIVIKQAYNPAKLPPFVKKQQQRLIELRSALLDTLDGVTKDAIRTRPEGGDSGVGGMHMGDAGSDSYDRDFALSMLAKEQDALYEINEALKRIDGGVYGICEMSANKIHEERLEALPYTRYTREMQEQIERDQIGGKFRRPVVRSVFGLDDASEEDDEDGDDDTTSNSTPNNDSSLDFGKD